MFFFLFVSQVVFCFLIAFLISSLVTPYIRFLKKSGVFIGNCSACISNSMLTVIHIRSFHLMNATHQLCCTKLNSNENDQSNILLICFEYIYIYIEIYEKKRRKRSKSEKTVLIVVKLTGVETMNYPFLD